MQIWIRASGAALLCAFWLVSGCGNDSGPGATPPVEDIVEDVGTEPKPDVPIVPDTGPDVAAPVDTEVPKELPETPDVPIVPDTSADIGPDAGADTGAAPDGSADTPEIVTGCTSAADCDDQIACTHDTCEANGQCSHAANDEACTAAGPCLAATCDAQQGCVQAPAPGNPPCDDGDPCTTGDSCKSGLCQGGAPPSCDDQNACTDDGCAPGQGCTHTANALPCDDGDACTVGERCQASACSGAQAVSCDDGNVCTLDTCDPASGCMHAATEAPAMVEIFGLPDGPGADAVTPVVSGIGAVAGSLSVTVDGEPFVLGGLVASEGPHVLVASALGCDGQPVSKSQSFVIDASPPALSYTLSAPPNEAGWHNQPVTVTFHAEDGLSKLASLSPPATVSLPGKGQVVTGTAVDAAGNVSTVSVTINLDMKPPEVVLSEPLPNLTGNDQFVTAADSLVFKGVLGSDTLSGFAKGRLTSTKHGYEAVFLKPGPFEVSVPLEPGVNAIVISATDEAGNAGTASVFVVADRDDPKVFIQQPPDGFQTVDAKLTIAGLAHDIVVGAITEEDVKVTVNGIPASVDQGQFVVHGVPLDFGINTLTAIATDAVGRTSTHTIEVTRLSAEIPHLIKVSGGGQSDTVRTRLAAPFVVRLVDAAGTTLPDTLVTFAVTNSDGKLDHPAADATSADGRSLAATTDSDGLAAVYLTLGGRSGAGLDRVTAHAQNTKTSVSFHATGLPGAAINMHLHDGDLQIGETGRPLPRPLSVRVSDAEGNPVDGEAVNFQALTGDGKFGGGTNMIALSNAKGFADVIFTPGQVKGYAAYQVRATIPGLADPNSKTQDGVTFTLSAFPKGAAPATTLTGKVLDQDEQPVAGVPVRFVGVTSDSETDGEFIIGGSSLSAVSAADGTFTIAGAPAGFSILEINGSALDDPQAGIRWPDLTIEVNLAQGVANTLQQPVYMLRLEEPVWVDGTEEVKLTTPGLDGFEMTIPAGTTLTFPDGSHEGYLSITQVHFDQPPMAPNDGLSTRMLVTIQPPNVRFDPPAPLQIPNLQGYPAGRKVEMYSYDHELETFVTIGPGEVSEDGTVIRSDPGVGVVKSGWHCGGNPSGSGGSASISASLSTSAAKAGAWDLQASGTPGKDTIWSWSKVCGPDLTVSGESCKGQSSCTGVASTSADAARGIVRVTHTCTETGASASADLAVTLCDVSSANVKVTKQFFGPEFNDVAGRVGDVLKLVGCEMKPEVDISASAQERDVCCPGCDGVTSHEMEMTVDGSASLNAECKTPLGYSFKSDIFSFKFGLFGHVNLGASASLGTVVTGCCPDPPCFCWQGAIGASLAGGLTLYLGSITLGKYNLIDVHGDANISVNGGFQVSCRKWCGAVCFGGLQMIGELTALNGAISYTRRYFLVCPRQLYGACHQFEIPSGAPTGGGCAAALNACGEPGPDPGGGGQPADKDAPACGAAPQGGTGSDASILECEDDQPQCSSDSGCDDGDPCNGTEVCDAAVGCVAMPGSTPKCDDLIDCTEDTCEKFEGCKYTPVDSNCQDSDGLACTVPTCRTSGGCVDMPTDSECPDDGVDCTEERCSVDFGCESTPYDSKCDDGIDCTADSCDEAADCQYEEQDAACGDGVDCTDDVCVAGSGCDNTPQDGLCDDGVDCTEDTCDASAGCSAQPDDASCDDGVACTKDVCEGFGCANTPDNAQCDDGVECTEDHCDAGGGCNNPPQDSVCDDGDACTGQETCTGGGCQNGTPLVCDDGVVCNGQETCDSAAGCVAGNPPPGCCSADADCKDNNVCNGTETCQGNVCVGGTGLVCDDNDPCNGQETCDPVGGCTSGTSLLCSNGDACDGLETCKKGFGCKSGTAPQCNDGDPCNGLEHCNPAVGCVKGTVKDCDDGDPCNGVESCVTNQGCVQGVAKVCDDGDACNGTETCVAGGGCVKGPAPQCDDHNLCNGTETCVAAQGCVASDPPVCDDNEPCNGVEICDAVVGCLAGAPPQCADGDACNGVETCVDGQGCTPGEPPVCDDGDPCNGVETCTPSGGCQPGTPLNACCQTSADCPGGGTQALCAGTQRVIYSCVANSCVPTTKPCPEGQSSVYCDGDTVRSWTCAAGDCHGTEQVCAQGTTCQSGACVTP